MSLVLLLLLLQSSSSSSLAAERMMVGAPKNIPNSNSVEIRELANFAVSQYNSGKVCMLLPPSSSSSSWYECSYNLFCSQDPILACGHMLVWKLWRREVCYDWSHTQMKHCECKTGPLSLSLSLSPLEDAILACLWHMMMVWKLWRKEACSDWSDWSHSWNKHCECKCPLSLHLKVQIHACLWHMIIVWKFGRKSVLWLITILVGGCFQNVVHKLSFSKVVSAREQVVAGTMYYLRIVVLESGTPKLYDCKIWVKPWENFKQLESFVPVVSPQCTLTDNPDTTATAAGNSSILL